VQVAHPAGYVPERRYAVEVLFETFFGIDVEVVEERVEKWVVRCGDNSFELPDIFFRMRPDAWGTCSSLPTGPDLYGEDLFGSAFFMLTRYEEAVLPDRDEHGRFPAVSTAAARHGFLERPVVNELAEKLWKQLSSFSPRLERSLRTFRVLPSHDVDHARSTLRQRAAAAKAAGVWSLRLRDPYDTFDLLMRLSEERDLRAAFYFLAAGARYSLEDPTIRRLLRRIHDRGHEIGFHASYEAFDDAARMRTEFETLVRTCEAEGIRQEEWGGRAHYLRWSPATWTTWADAGIAYDASVGFSERAGFRTGSCYEYPVFDARARRRLPLRERPLVLMDNPTISRLGLTAEQAQALALRLRGACEQFDGDFTSLWHNSWVVTSERRRLLETALGPAHLAGGPAAPEGHARSIMPRGRVSR
jgi:Family of unknown function (DUF7033)